MTSWSKNEPYPLLWGLCLPVRYYDWTTYQPILRENSKRVRLTESLLLSSFCHILSQRAGSWDIHHRCSMKIWNTKPEKHHLSCRCDESWCTFLLFGDPMWSHVTLPRSRHHFPPSPSISSSFTFISPSGSGSAARNSPAAIDKKGGASQESVSGHFPFPPGTWLHIQKIALSCNSLEWTNWDFPGFGKHFFHHQLLMFNGQKQDGKAVELRSQSMKCLLQRHLKQAELEFPEIVTTSWWFHPRWSTDHPKLANMKKITIIISSYRQYLRISNNPSDTFNCFNQ